MMIRSRTSVSGTNNPSSSAILSHLIKRYAPVEQSSRDRRSAEVEPPLAHLGGVEGAVALDLAPPARMPHRETARVEQVRDQAAMAAPLLLGVPRSARAVSSVAWL